MGRARLGCAPDADTHLPASLELAGSNACCKMHLARSLVVLKHLVTQVTQAYGRSGREAARIGKITSSATFAS
jgi:hypothetical protein